MSTGDVAATIHSHVAAGSGTVRNMRPPKVTMSHWPASITASTNSSPRSCFSPCSAERPVPSALALSRFHHCNMTKSVKKTVSSSADTPATCSK